MSNPSEQPGSTSGSKLSLPRKSGKIRAGSSENKMKAAILKYLSMKDAAANYFVKVLRESVLHPKIYGMVQFAFGENTNLIVDKASIIPPDSEDPADQDRKKNLEIVEPDDEFISQDELNLRVEAFIKKFNEEMKLQRLNSRKQFTEMGSTSDEIDDKEMTLQRLNSRKQFTEMGSTSDEIDDKEMTWQRLNSRKQFTEMDSTSDEIDDRVENDPIVHEEEPLSTVSSETIDSLPSDLKRCLLYTSVFPRNYVFEKDALIHLWIDAGFISDEKGLVEMIGGDYFGELLSLKIFHETSVDCSNVQPRLYKIEDNVFDLLKNHAAAEDTASQDDDASKHQISASDLETSTLAVERVLETANQGPPSNQDVMVSSFDNLPKHLRRCLRYTSLFGRHYEFEKDKLVHLWIAAGLIFDEQGKLMEDTGGEYFDQLLTMNLFCESSVESSLFSVEDNVYDQLQECPDGDYARLEGDEGGKVSAQARHLSVIDDRVDKLDLEAFKKLSELQSLLLLQAKKRCITRIPYDLFLNLKCLRILDLSSTGLEELPSSVGSLEELRYLDLSDTCIRLLPETLTSLFNLQTLKLRDCCDFVQLPKDIRKMTGLRHLDLDIIQQLTFMPAGMGKLTNLQTLRAFVVGKNNGSKIAELKKMENLRGSLGIIKLEHVLTAEEAKEAMLHSKRLYRLILQWSRPCLAEEVLEALEPNKHLEELEIVCYGGRVLSSWLGDSSFFRLSSIYLYNCKNCILLPPLGRLPCLQLLRIGQMDAVKEVNNHFSNAGHLGMGFPRLEILQFEGMPGLEKWIGITKDEMPCLRELTVIDCPKLIQFPKLSFLKFLQHLEIGLCFQLPLLIEEGVSLPTSLERLVINDCPKLEEWCHTVEWKQIAGRASIWINGKQIP